MSKKLKQRLKSFKKWFIPEIKYRLKQRSGGAIDYKDVPIVINNFNRLSMLLRLIASLESRGYNHLYIIDNASSYPPLLDWYRHCKYPVFMLNRNEGHLSIWNTGIYKIFTDSYFVYTDADMEISPDCPDNFMEYFIGLLKKYPTVLKCGFSIRIDDLPDTFDNKQEVTEWESQFWKKELEPNVYNAPIDTTFAVYKPYFKGEIIDFNDTYIRTGFPYTIRHLPWYINSNSLSDEDKYYLSHIKTSTHWSEKEKNNKK